MTPNNTLSFWQFMNKEMKGWMSEPTCNNWHVIMMAVFTTALFVLQAQAAVWRFMVLILYFAGMYLCDLSVKEYKTLHPNIEPHDTK